ncbi:MAG TPA: hypothetical protein VFI23_16030 [Rhizomicrobium sp.]|nr:hypothetical protein [Rhizomicrobium sp.]
MRSAFLLAARLWAAAMAVALATSMGTGPAMAQNSCVEPATPMPLDGAVATADQMRAAMADARGFVAQSGLYQECLQQEVEAAKAQASSSGQPFEAAIETNARARIDASKKAQERVSATVNNALAAFKNAHPNGGGR